MSSTLDPAATPGFDTVALHGGHGGDPATTDVSRILRLPGFTNRKYNEQFVIRVHHELDQVYHLGDFRVQEDSPDAPRHLADAHEPTRRMPSGHRSQSEADWAYAKRALARGDDVEEIIRRIADYRADDKADPAYYARLTVVKAQRVLVPPERDRATSRESVPLTDRDH